MEKGVLISIAVVSLIILGVVVYNFSVQNVVPSATTSTEDSIASAPSAPAEPTTAPAEPTTAPATPAAANTTPTTTGKTFTVEITSSGFLPSTVEINKGDNVIFINKDSSNHWPASASHPTHTVYPESGGCIGSKFDACKGLKQGENWSFTFDQAGTWGYHDHLNPSNRGTIVVK